ncbi:hypothetical protein [Rossellomorea marisflavi]
MTWDISSRNRTYANGQITLSSESAGALLNSFVGRL